MRPHLGLAVGLVSLTAIASLALPATSLGAVTCARSGPDRLLTVVSADASTRIIRSGQEIVVNDSRGPVDCAGGTATVNSTDRVQISHSGRRGDVLSLNGGPFAPGAEMEPSGAPEIEFDYLDPTHLNINGTPGADRLTWGPGGAVNLNGDDDVDVSGPFTTNILQGFAGNDVIAAQGDYSGTGRELVATGGSGKDTIIAPPSGAVVHGGAAKDRLIGGRRADNITGGRGNDLIRSGKGRDLIRASDGTRDRVNCGPGIDKVKADGIDTIRNCERRILFKRR